jgi:hypothetical protein
LSMAPTGRHRGVAYHDMVDTFWCHSQLVYAMRPGVRFATRKILGGKEPLSRVRVLTRSSANP